MSASADVRVWEDVLNELLGSASCYEPSLHTRVVKALNGKLANGPIPKASWKKLVQQLQVCVERAQQRAAHVCVTL